MYYALSETTNAFFPVLSVSSIPKRYGTFADNRYAKVTKMICQRCMLVIRKDGTPLGTPGTDGDFCRRPVPPVHQPARRGATRVRIALVRSFPWYDEIHAPADLSWKRVHTARWFHSPLVFGEYLGEPGEDFRGGDGDRLPALYGRRPRFPKTKTIARWATSCSLLLETTLGASPRGTATGVENPFARRVRVLHLVARFPNHLVVTILVRKVGPSPWTLRRSGRRRRSRPASGFCTRPKRSAFPCKNARALFPAIHLQSVSGHPPLRV